MFENLESEALNEISIELKNIKKLIKYLNGLSKAPEQHKPRISKNIEYLINKVRTGDLEKLEEKRNHLERKLEEIKLTLKQSTYLEHIRGWYLRPLINHFDDQLKMRSFTSTIEGTGALKKRLQLFIPKPFFNLDDEITKNNLAQLLRFKTFGKGTERSSRLENTFFDQLRFNEISPCQETTLGKLDLPVIHYNVHEFFKKMKAGEGSVLVTGLCPVSTITNELGLATAGGQIERPVLGFEPLSLIKDKVTDIIWPEKPSLSDYIMIRNILELYKLLKRRGNVSVIIWYPYHEYFLDIINNILVNYVNSGLIQEYQIKSGLDQLKETYFKLIKIIRQELGLVGEEYNDDIKIIEVNDNKYNELEEFRKKINLSFFKYIYGSWVGNELRRALYEQLIIKHILPARNGVNVLHLDTSYELWVELLGSIAVEKQEDVFPGRFSWINYPSLPSISLSHMREYNAQYNDKLYLSMDSEQFRERLEKVSGKYCQHVAPLILGKDNVENKEFNGFIGDLKTRLIELNHNLVN
jgi:hypothetical protein